MTIQVTLSLLERREGSFSLLILGKGTLSHSKKIDDPDYFIQSSLCHIKGSVGIFNYVGGGSPENTIGTGGVLRMGTVKRLYDTSSEVVHLFGGHPQSRLSTETPESVVGLN